MHRRRRFAGAGGFLLLLAALAVLTISAGLYAQSSSRPTTTTPTPSEPSTATSARETATVSDSSRLSRSARNANYTISVTLDPQERTLAGRQVVRWRNTQTVATNELWFHLYWNAWRNDQSTWMLESRRSNRRMPKLQDDTWSYLEVDAVRMPLGPGLADATADLTDRMRFAAPDDGNAEDRTVMVVDLPRAIEPGEEISVEMEWRAKVPRTFARTGFRGDYFFLSHWFPKLGVFEGEDGWNCHQFHVATEFFSDYGVYDVEMTVPSHYVLGATGREVERREDTQAGTTTYRHQQDDVHGFAWTTSPDLQVAEQRFEVSGLPPVDMRLLYQREHRAQVDRHFKATAAALELFGRWYGPYPYGHITVVDPAYGSGTGGMEYPTIFTCGTRRFNPFGSGSPEGVTVHEAGHQFWYALVGNNEFEDAWIDEGLNTFSTHRVMGATYGRQKVYTRYFSPPGTSMRAFFPIRVRGVTREPENLARRLDGYRRSARADEMSKPTYLYDPKGASNLTYSKTALWLATLERHLGWDTLQTILSTFFERWTFRHPGPQDFIDIANEVALAETGADLDWYFDQVYRSEAVFDYAVQSVSSRKIKTKGWIERDGELVLANDAASTDDEGSAAETSDDTETSAESSPTRYRNEVVVRRMGDGIFPVDVLIRFEDGQEIRESWDGRSLWRLFVYESESKVERAIVDPDRVLLLDLQPSNNSRLREAPGRLAARKWASKWGVWLQDLMSTFSFFV